MGYFTIVRKLVFLLLFFDIVIPNHAQIIPIAGYEYAFIDFAGSDLITHDVADDECSSAVPQPAYLAVVTSPFLQAVFNDIDVFILGFPGVIFGKIIVSGKKESGDIYLRTEGNNKILPFTAFKAGEESIYSTEWCTHLDNGDWKTGTCDAIPNPVVVVCQGHAHEYCPKEDCPPEATGPTDTEVCVWEGDTEETYAEARIRCEAQTNGALLPLYTDEDVTWLKTKTYLTRVRYFQPFLLHTNVDQYNLRWPNGESLRTDAFSDNIPFTIADAEAVYFSTEDLKDIVLVYNSADDSAEFENINTYTARALCMQPLVDFACVFTVDIEYGHLVESQTSGLLVCDSGYEYTGDPSFTCTCPDRDVNVVEKCTKILECLADPCLNTGSCIEKVGDYECLCPLGYEGKNCEIVQPTPCDGDPCINGGSCYHDLSGVYSCLCTPGYSGIRCQIAPLCLSGTCLNNGICSVNGTSYYCTCVPGWIGTHCEEEKNECVPSPCRNGYCTDLFNDYRCTCYAGYTGTDCKVEIDECAEVTCTNQGICYDQVNSFHCECNAGYSGQQCETEIDECTPNPCQNEGACTDGVANFECSCRSGFSGQYCQQEIDECTPNPCQNEGACTDKVDNFECSCRSGFSGRYCQQDVCYEGCLNGGICQLIGDIKTCGCPDGYTGLSCEEPPTSQTLQIVAVAIGVFLGVVLLIVVVFCFYKLNTPTPQCVAPQAPVMAPGMSHFPYGGPPPMFMPPRRPPIMMPPRIRKM